MFSGCQTCLLLRGNQHAWDLQESVPLGMDKLAKMKLIENNKRDWGEAVLTPLNV